MGRAGGREGRKGVERSAAQGLEAPPRLSMRAAGPVERLRDGQRDRRLEPPAHNRGAPTVTEAPTRTETYAPTRMTEAPSYAPTTDTYAPTMAPTATGVPTFTDAPTGAPTNATNAPTPSIVRRRALLEKGSSFIDESVWFQRALAADKSGVVQSLRDIWGY